MKGFEKRLQRSRAEIEYVTMDLGQTFTSWVQTNLPGAIIIYDHFHVIKLMNDSLNKVRRSTMGKLEEEQRRSLKNGKNLLLRNFENLSLSAREHLDTIKNISENLNIMHTMKENLRAIYSTAMSGVEAGIQLIQWIKSASSCSIDILKRTARTIEKRLEGITAFWDTRLSNSHMEGFNSKLRELIKTAYGYRDDEFLTFKIYDLPDQKIIDLACPPSERNSLKNKIIFAYSTSKCF